jgi:hypothetical protein
MNRLILTAILAGTFAWFAPDAHACSCIIPEVPQAFDKSHAVFVGEVTEIVKPRTDDPKAPPADRLYTVKFKVEKSWKGAGFKDMTVSEIVVLSDQGRAGCFSWGSFVEGRKYLVYAEETKGENLAVLFSCNRTVALANASGDLEALDRMSKPAFKYRSKRRSGLNGSFYTAPNNSFNRSANRVAFRRETLL